MHVSFNLNILSHIANLRAKSLILYRYTLLSNYYQKIKKSQILRVITTIIRI